MIEAFTQVRRQVLELCAQQRFSTARLYLIGSGCNADTHTSLWEYVARRSDDAGNTAVARNIRKELWEAGVGSSDVALRQADEALEQQSFEAAEYLLETTFGSDTHNHEARRRFAQSYFKQAERIANEGARLRTNSARALKLASDFSFQKPTDATVLIDLLRYSGELSLALDKTLSARKQFGDDIRFATREARIIEQMNDLARAAELWEEISESSERLRGEALLKLCQLYERLERAEALRHARARLSISDVSVADRLRLALSTGQAGMAHALTEYVGLGGANIEELPTSVTTSFAEQLLDSGEIGLAVWLRRQRVPVGDRVKRVLDAMGFAVGGTRQLPDTVEEAVAIRSPDFMLPLENTLKLRPKPKGWPGVGRDPKRILLVNASLGIGGAERQFVELARALLESGIGKDQLHVAVFSLAQDRGHAHFLPDLEALGIPIHHLADRAELNPNFTPTEHNLIEALPSNLRSDLRILLPLVKELQPDVLHGWQDASAAACSIAGTAASVSRIILSARNMSPATRRDKSLVLNEGLFREMATKDNVMISANSQIAADDYANWLGCEAERIDVIPNAIDMSRYPALPKTAENPDVSGPLRIGGVFRLAINKRPLLWLRTIHALRHEQKIDLLPFLFGSGPLAHEVEMEAEALGLSDLVLRSGVVDPQELYGELDMMLLMSQVEGLPNVVIEAQAMGKPVAACDVGGVREAVKRGGKGAGLILEPNVTASEAAAQIASWLPGARAAPPYLIQQHISNTFDPKLLAHRTLQTYRGYKVAPS